jgi:hypothetical protein
MPPCGKARSMGMGRMKPDLDLQSKQGIWFHCGSSLWSFHSTETPPPPQKK